MEQIQTLPDHQAQGPMQVPAGFGYAASSLANALLKERSHWWWLTNAHPWRRMLPPHLTRVAVVPLRGLYVLIPVHAAVEVAVFRCYDLWWQVIDKQVRSIDLISVAQLLADESECVHTAQRFEGRVIDSVSQVNELLRQRDLSTLFQPETRFIDSEQALLGGHPCHPCPRSKEGFVGADIQRYAPENRGHFQLHWLAVQHSQLIMQHRGEALPQRLLNLCSEDPQAAPLTEQLREGEVLWPMHPWQAQRLLAMPELNELQKQGALRSLGEAGRWWTATSSLRCVYHEQASAMLKYSLSVRLTNSLRHLLPREVERGLQVVDIWDGPSGQALQQQFASFTVIREPAWLALRDSSGAALAASITVLRDNPFRGAAAEQVFMMGSLCQLPPSGQPSQLAQVITAKAENENISARRAAMEWYQRFLEVAIAPLLMAQANEGLLFGAHQQNTLLRLNNFNPAHFYYRDCQGTGFSQLGVERHAEALGLPSGNGNQLHESMANRLFAYYLIVNNLFAVIAAIASDGLLPERSLLQLTRAFLQQLRNRPLHDTSCLDYLLHSEQLYFKGNLHCSLYDFNENTLSDPLQLYRPQRNPLWRNSSSEE